MKKYSYVPLRYVHDSTSGESLNVGVVMYLPKSGRLTMRAIGKTARLKAAFRDFDPQGYKEAVGSLRRGLTYLQQKSPIGVQESLFDEGGLDADGVVALVWPDKGTQYTLGGVGFGTTDDSEKTLDALYKRLVEDQAPPTKSEDRAKDELLWKKVIEPLRETSNAHKITKITIHTPSGPIDAQYAYKNGSTNVFQPLSFDLQEERSITRKASTWYGYGELFSNTPTVGRVAYLLGAPADSSKMPVFLLARDFLIRMEKVKVYLEEDLAGFANFIDETVA